MLVWAKSPWRPRKRKAPGNKTWQSKTLFPETRTRVGTQKFLLPQERQQKQKGLIHCWRVQFPSRFLIHTLFWAIGFIRLSRLRSCDLHTQLYREYSLWIQSVKSTLNSKPRPQTSCSTKKVKKLTEISLKHITCQTQSMWTTLKISCTQ